METSEGGTSRDLQKTNGFSSLHPPPLDHDNAFLSPSASAQFNVDDFLLSRAPGSTLKEIAVELQEYSVELKDQLNVVVDRDFKGFVSLGAALKAEGPRIARLDWKVATSHANTDQDSASLTRKTGDDEEWNQMSDTPRGSGGNLGLDRVRSEVVDVRDQLRKAEEDVRRVIKSQEEGEAQKANLMLLLSLTDSLRRLEALLLSSPSLSEKQRDEETSSEEDVAIDQTAKFWQAFTKVKEDQDSESDYDSSDDEKASDAKHQYSSATPDTRHMFNSVARKTSSKGQRSTSRLVSGRRRSSYGLEVVTKRADNIQSNKLNLPVRIARASSEHAALLFLRERALAMGFTNYVAAHEARSIRARELLKDDLRKLIVTLSRYQGPSLLVGKIDKVEQNPYARIAEAELEGWSINSNDKVKQKEEETVWFESALRTWCDLPPSDPEIHKMAAIEAEETIRAALISTWVRQTITADALSRRNSGPKTPKTPFSLERPGWIENDLLEGEVSVPLLPSNLVDYSEDDDQVQALIGLYNEILTFTSTQASALCQAAERVLVKRDQDCNAPSSGSPIQTGSCDIFVRVVWEEVATRLMEQLGGQLFFAGRPDVFHRNYTISMEFLSAFESLAPSQRSRDALHQHPSYLTFRKRWQLPVYFQIRLRDSINRLEKALASSCGTSFGSVSLEHYQSHSMPLMVATKEVLLLFTLPWKKGMHIMELAHRQWRLSLQILSRYKNWVEEELPSDIVLANRKALESAKSSSAPRLSHDLSRTASPVRGGTPTAADPESDDSLLSTFTAVAADLIWIGRQVEESFDKEIAPLFASKQGSEALIDSLRQTLQESILMLEKIVPLLSARITSILKGRCAEPLRLVRSRVQPNMGLTSSNNATEPSSYVIQFLRPLRLYLGKSEGKSLDSRRSEISSRFLDRYTRSQWMTEVIEDFVTRYAASLRTMNKNYESLRRLKRGNTASTTMGFSSLFSRGSSGNATSSTIPGQGNNKIEEDQEAKRMHLQMEIDVQCLEKEVGDLISVDTDIQTNTAAWKRLKEAARGEQDDE